MAAVVNDSMRLTFLCVTDLLFRIGYCQYLYPDLGRLAGCNLNAVRCPTHFALLYCYGSKGQCRYRCPLGQPVFVSSAYNRLRRCGYACPAGYFARRRGDFDVCERHTQTCPRGQSVIVEGTSWHDKVCGDEKDYVLPYGFIEKPKSQEFLNVLNNLTRNWLPFLPERTIETICLSLFGSVTDSCKYSADTLNGITLEQIYYILNANAPDQVRALHHYVLRPFVHSGDRVPTPRIAIQRELWRIEDKIIVPTFFTLPLGAPYEFVRLHWARQFGNGVSPLILDENQDRAPTNPRLRRGQDWNIDMKGYLVHTFDVSLILPQNTDIQRLYVSAYIEHKFTKQAKRFHKSVHIDQMWKPQVHSYCNCTRSLLDYGNPGGLCSPACLPMYGSFVHHIDPKETNGDLWILNITRGDSVPTESTARGWTLFGTVKPKTERFCLVTVDIFKLPNGLDHSTPGVPLEFTVCDVLLLEFEIRIGHVPVTDEQHDPPFLQLPVRSLESGATERLLSVPSEAANVLKKILEHGWAPRMGVKLSFLHKTRNRAGKDELAAILDWMLTLSWHRARVHPVAVIDINYMSFRNAANRETGDILEVHLPDFTTIDRLYGSRLELIPLLSAGTIAHLIEARGYTVDTHGDPHVPDFHIPFTKEQERSESALQELGTFVSSHGAFLDVDKISDFFINTAPCINATPGRWMIAERLPLNAYEVQLSKSNLCPERTGVMVFEELTRRSGNRAGIVVSIASASYSTKPNAPWAERIVRNRHHDGEDSGHIVIKYSMRDLEMIISDMAKWGVCRYSLGYLDYTRDKAANTPTFMTMSNAIAKTTNAIRALTYRYTRHTNDVWDTRVRVDGVYKLDGGIFFQFTRNEKDQPVRSFGTIPGIPHLRLGLSTDMNVGAERTVKENTYPNIIEMVDSVPHDARVVHLPDSGNYMEAYVDWKRHVICVHKHIPSKPAANERVAQIPSFGVRSEGEGDPDAGCPVYISGAEHRAWVSAVVYMPKYFNSPLVKMFPQMQDSLRTLAQRHVLTDADRTWLSNQSIAAERLRTNVSDWDLSVEHLAARRLLASVIQCIRDSTFCTALAEYAVNGWPSGGSGRPIALNVLSSEHGILLLKMIIVVRHGMVRSMIPCGLKIFSFDSDRSSPPAPMWSYYTASERRQSEMLKRDAIHVGSLIQEIVDPIVTLYCPRTEYLGLEPTGSVLSRARKIQMARSCMSVRNESMRDPTFYSLDELSQWHEHVKIQQEQALYVTNLTWTLCVSAIVLAVLIVMIVFMTICCQSDLRESGHNSETRMVKKTMKDNR